MSDAKPEPTVDPSEEIVDKPRRGWGGCAIGCLFGVLILYVLSPPLVTMIMLAAIDGGWGPPEAMESVINVVYAPLQWLYENVEPVEKFYDWYLGLFERWLTP